MESEMNSVVQVVIKLFNAQVRHHIRMSYKCESYSPYTNLGPDRHICPEYDDGTWSICSMIFIVFLGNAKFIKRCNATSNESV